MFKVLHTADSHFSSKRLDECVYNANHICEMAEKYQPNLIVHSGDLFHKNTLINSREYLAAVEFITSLSFQAPVLIIRGNHDPEDSFYPFKFMSGVTVVDKIDTVEYDRMDEAPEYPFPVKIFCLPYQKLLSTKGETVDEAKLEQANYLRSQINEFTAREHGNALLLCVGHISIAGVELANSERILGGEVMLNKEDFVGFHGSLLGHIHKSEQDILEGTSVAYSGSHYRTRFDEVAKPGFRIWEFELKNDKWKLNNNKLLLTPARDMIQFDLDIEETKAYITSGKFPYEFEENADYKVIFRVPEGLAHKLNKDNLIEEDLVNYSLKVSTIVEPKSEVKSKKIANLKTKEEIFEEWAEVSKIKIHESLKEKFGEIVEECGD